MRSFNDWYFDLFESGNGACLNQQEIAEEAWDYRQTEVDELQKQVDASLIAFEKLKEEINQLHGQCDLHLIKYLEEKSQVLEQALKSGGE